MHLMKHLQNLMMNSTVINLQLQIMNQQSQKETAFSHHLQQMMKLIILLKKLRMTCLHIFLEQLFLKITDTDTNKSNMIDT
jgi:hypothetical protein